VEGFMIGFNRSTLNLLVRHGRWIGDPDDENILLRYVLGQGMSACLAHSDGSLLKNCKRGTAQTCCAITV
jgi:hypothetical protein